MLSSCPGIHGGRDFCGLFASCGLGPMPRDSCFWAVQHAQQQGAAPRDIYDGAFIFLTFVLTSVLSL